MRTGNQYDRHRGDVTRLQDVHAGWGSLRVVRKSSTTRRALVDILMQPAFSKVDFGFLP